MDRNMLALTIGGLIPALFYGTAGVVQKANVRAGGTVATYLMGFGLATLLGGLIFQQILGEGPSTPRAWLFAGIAGLSFAAGAGLISFAIIRYEASIAQLSPLYNMNVLVTVGMGLLIFSEFANLNVPRLLIGTITIILGGWLVLGA
jgi:drug/metabolite transporter (DMT)-like permease